MSTSPAWSAATRVVASGIGRKTRVLTFGATPHHASLASMVMASSFAQRTNLYGPDPTGALASVGPSLSLKYLGGTIAPRRASWFSRLGKGFLVSTRTVCLSGASILSTREKFG